MCSYIQGKANGWGPVGVVIGDKTEGTRWGQSERFSGLFQEFGPQPGGL